MQRILIALAALLVSCSHLGPRNPQGLTIRKLSKAEVFRIENQPYNPEKEGVSFKERSDQYRKVVLYVQRRLSSFGENEPEGNGDYYFDYQMGGAHSSSVMVAITSRKLLRHGLVSELHDALKDSGEDFQIVVWADVFVLKKKGILDIGEMHVLIRKDEILFGADDATVFDRIK